MRIRRGGTIANVRTSDDSPITRITAPDKERFSWLTRTVKLQYKVRAYVEMTDERLLIVSDLPAGFLESLTKMGFSVCEDEPAPSSYLLQWLVLGIVVFTFLLCWALTR